MANKGWPMRIVMKDYVEMDDDIYEDLLPLYAESWPMSSAYDLWGGFCAWEAAVNCGFRYNAFVRRLWL
jgi:hypothetical protein